MSSLLSQRLRSAPNVLIINLAISDLSFAAINGFPLKTISAFNQHWNWGKTGSYIPEGFHTSCTFDYLSSDLGNLLFNAGMYLFAFICPVTVIIFSYAQIIKAVHDSENFGDVKCSRRHRSNAPSSDATCTCTPDPHADTKSAYICANRNSVIHLLTMNDFIEGHSTSITATARSDIQTVKLSAVLVLLYLASWGPYAFICFVSLLGHRKHLTPFTAEIPVLCAKSSCMFNPIVYALMHRNFRQELFLRLGNFGFPCCDKQVNNSDAISTIPEPGKANIIITDASPDTPEASQGHATK
ncbi:unnamed protein product [Echinostoma caproni]|uniref:G_PROTEIN_RECEP_F1_2 domain-containing protein n=1 Tax=Echinostoma caproni TaxID=27848 RepID=A0A183A5U2_9TREM|nr:unnamed protein product [Echinostoma caproni]